MEKVRRSVNGRSQPKEAWEVCLTTVLRDPDNDHDQKKKRQNNKKKAL